MSETVDIAGNMIVFPDRRPNYKLHPQIAMDIVDFFLDCQNHPDYRDDPDYQGFDRVAAELQQQLEKVSKPAKKRAPIRCSLPLMPLDEQEPYRLYRDEYIPEGTSALMLLTDRLTHAKLLLDNRDERTGFGQVITRGYYNGQTVYFFETHTWDPEDEYMIWEVANEVPDDSLPKPVVLKPFVTTGEKNQLWDDLLADMNELPTVKEPSRIKKWIQEQKKLRKSA